MRMSDNNAFRMHHTTEGMETQSLDIKLQNSTPTVVQTGLCQSIKHDRFQRGVIFLK